MIKQTKDHRDHHTVAAVYILIAENSNNSKQNCAGISHREDCWIKQKRNRAANHYFTSDHQCL